MSVMYLTKIGVVFFFFFFFGLHWFRDFALIMLKPVATVDI